MRSHGEPMDRPESPAAFHRGVLPLAGPYPSSSSPHAICFMFVAQCEDTPWAAGAPLVIFPLFVVFVFVRA